MTPNKSPDRPKVPEVRPLVRAIYAREGGSCGCCLHVMMDDGNVEEEFAQLTVASARARGHADCIEAAEKLAQMTPTQRGKIYRTLRNGQSSTS